MARGMNRAMIIGLVESEPELRRTADGRAVSWFGVSANLGWTTTSGQARESAEWFHVVAWGRLAELAASKLRRGQRVYAEGHIQTRRWDDSDGGCRFLTELVASKMIPLDCSCERGGWGQDPEAASGLNRAMVIGNLGRDPDTRYTAGGQAWTSFALAVTRTWAAVDGARRDSTEWFSILAWGSLAEICSQYLTKGRRVYVEGELRMRGWEQPTGQWHFRTELMASEMIMLGPRPNGDMGSDECLS